MSIYRKTFVKAKIGNELPDRANCLVSSGHRGDPVELWSGKFEETSVTLFARACIQKKTATPFPSEEHSRLCLRSTA